MKCRFLAALAALALGSPASAQTTETAPAAVDYADPANWLCRPGRADPCGTPLPTTALNASGYGSVGASKVAAYPPADCFYVYPTVSRDPGDNSDLAPGIEEKGAAAVQFARFASVCRTFAPIYRQATLTALQKAMRGENVTRNFTLAFQDVTAAWRHYLEHDNQGRPFVLIGHSQGTILLSMLLAQEIEKGAALPRMLSALLVGYNVEVPEGKLVGGTFSRTPLCSRFGETGCVVTYVSFRASSPPPPGSLFGRTMKPGMTVGCTNPARLVRGSAKLDSYWYAGPSATGVRSDIDWATGAAPPTPFLRTEGLVSAACVNRGNVGYLAVTVNADPSDPRTDRIPGDVFVGGALQPGWGLHLTDVNLALGNLIALVGEQARAYGARVKSAR